MRAGIRLLGVSLAFLLIGFVGYVSAIKQTENSKQELALLTQRVENCVSEVAKDTVTVSKELESFLKYSYRAPDFVEEKDMSTEELMSRFNAMYLKWVYESYKKQTLSCLSNTSAFVRANKNVSGNALLDQWFPDDASWSNFVQNVGLGLLFVLVGIGLEALVLARTK